MKKLKSKILTFAFLLCIMLPCMFMLTACLKGNDCTHEWFIEARPTFTSEGYVACSNCNEGKFDLPKLGSNEYVQDTTNPDYTTYTYTKDGKDFKFYSSNFEFSFSVGGAFEYACVESYNGTNTEIVIPETVVSVNGEVPVTTISQGAFYNKTNITKVTLPSRLTRIEGNAFSGCTSLTSINLEEGLKEILSNAFRGTPFKEIVVPDSVTMLGAAFTDCNNLEKLTVPLGNSPHSALRMGYLFGDNVNSTDNVPASLKEVVVSGNATTISGHAFSCCENLQRVVFSNNI